MRRNVFTTYDPNLPMGKKFVAVHVQNEDPLYFLVEVKSKVCELFMQISKFLNLLEPELFGLAIKSSDTFIFLDPLEKLSKYAPKQWKTQNNGMDNDGLPLFNVYFRVQFYVDSYLFIGDKVAKYYYYHQLRENVLHYEQSMCQERAFLLASYALQADYGNYNPKLHKNRYFDPNHYFPAWVIEELGSEYIQRHLPSLHCDHKGISKSEAQSMFIREASDSSSSSAHNFHLYKMVSNKKSSTVGSSDIWLAITITGLMIYSAELNASGHNRRLKTRISFFPWSDIGKLSFDKKKFEIRSTGPQSRKFVYYTPSEEIARFLLWFSRASHQFHLMVLPKMREMLKREAEINRRKYRESCISSTMAINGNSSRNSSSGNSSGTSGMSTGSQRNRNGNRHNSNANSSNTSKSVSPFEFSSVVSSNSDTKKETSDLDISTLSVCCSIDMLNDGTHCKNDDRQRVSVISNASSNTTSGIASDKMHDGLCEDSDPESDLLMSLNRHHINTHRAIIGLSGCSPQPVVSMESLAMSEPIDHHRSCHPNHLIHNASKSEMMRNKKHSVSISNIMITANAASSSSSSSSVVVPSTDGSISSFIGSNSPSVKALAVQHPITSANNVDETKKGSKILLRLNMENTNRIIENDKDDNDDNSDSYDDIDGNSSTSMFDSNNRYHNGSGKSNVTVLSTILKPEAERLLKQGIEADEVATELNNNHQHIDSFELQELKEFEQAEKEKIILNSLIDNIPPPPTSLHDDDSSDSDSSSSSDDDTSSESDDECENKINETSNNGGHYSPTALEKCLHKTNDSSLQNGSSNRTHSRMRSKSSAASIETTNTSIKLPTMNNNNNWITPGESTKQHIYENVSTLGDGGNFDLKYSQVVQALITPAKKHSVGFPPTIPLRPYPSLNSVPVATCNGHPPFRGTGMKIGVSSLSRGNASQNNSLLQNGYQPIMNKSINYHQNYLADSLQNISAAGSEPNLYYGANNNNSVRNNLDNNNDYLWKTSTPKSHHANNKFGHLVQNQLGYGANLNETSMPSKCTFNASKLKLDLSMLHSNQSATKTNGHLSTKKPSSVIVPTSDSVYITPPPSADYNKKCSNEQLSPSKLVTSQANLTPKSSIIKTKESRLKEIRKRTSDLNLPLITALFIDSGLTLTDHFMDQPAPPPKSQSMQHLTPLSNYNEATSGSCSLSGSGCSSASSTPSRASPATVERSYTFRVDC